MTLEPDGKYQIVYNDGGDEKTAVVRYRGLMTSDDLARGGESRVPTEGAPKHHWFQVDGSHGFLAVDPDDLISYEVAE